MRRLYTNILFAAFALLVTSGAHAAPGQTTGNANLSSSFGVREGTSRASVDLSFNSAAGFTHDDGVQSTLGAFAWSAPSVQLFGHRETFWNVTVGGATARAKNGNNLTGAFGTVQFAGTTYFNCSQPSGARTYSNCPFTNSLNRTYAEGDMTYWILGIIPVEVGGRINANLTSTVSGYGHVNSLSNATATTTDQANGSASITGSVSGTGWFFVGIDGVVGAGGSATVSFLRVTLSGPYAQSRRVKCNTSHNGCTTNARVRYEAETRAGATNYSTLDGNIRVRGCLIDCGQATLLSWQGRTISSSENAALGRYTADSFRGTY